MVAITFVQTDYLTTDPADEHSGPLVRSVGTTYSILKELALIIDSPLILHRPGQMTGLKLELVYYL
jgi:hypothetical protein